MFRLFRFFFLLPIFFFTTILLAHEDEAFVPYFQDLPLMKGLEISEGEALLFDTTDGHIISVTAYSKMPPKKIAAFYAHILPQLGWKQIDKNLYRREGESLKIEITLKGFLTKIHFFSFPTQKQKSISISSTDLPS